MAADPAHLPDMSTPARGKTTPASTAGSFTTHAHGVPDVSLSDQPATVSVAANELRIGQRVYLEPAGATGFDPSSVATVTSTDGTADEVSIEFDNDPDTIAGYLGDEPFVVLAEAAPARRLGPSDGGAALTLASNVMAAWDDKMLCAKAGSDAVEALEQAGVDPDRLAYIGLRTKQYDYEPEYLAGDCYDAEGEHLGEVFMERTFAQSLAPAEFRRGNDREPPYLCPPDEDEGGFEHAGDMTIDVAKMRAYDWDSAQNLTRLAVLSCLGAATPAAHTNSAPESVPNSESHDGDGIWHGKPVCEFCGATVDGMLRDAHGNIVCDDHHDQP